MKKLLIIILILLFGIYTFSSTYYVTKTQGDSFCYAIGYDYSQGWDYSQKLIHNKSNFVDCCIMDSCNRIYFDIYREERGGKE